MVVQLHACTLNTYLNHGDSMVEKGCKPFTINHVTALWHSFILSVVIFPLLAKVNGVTVSDVPGACVWRIAWLSALGTLCLTSEKKKT